MRKHNGRTSTQRYRATRKVALGLAICAALVVSIFGATSTLVGAVTTDNSTVHGNEFAKALRVDAGVYNLTATPENGTAFGQGPTAGTVSFDMLPSAPEQIGLTTGDTITVDVKLPSGVTPTELPSDETANEFTRVWSKSEKNNTWTVSQSVTVTGSGQVTLPKAMFGITTDFAEIRSQEEVTIRATAELPERYVSTHATESTIIPTSWNIMAGVYDLNVSANSANSITVQYASHPDNRGETLYLVPGDAIVTSVTLPAGVSPTDLPDTVETEGITYTWSSEPIEQGCVVTQTQTITAPIETYGPTKGVFEANVSNQVWNSGFTVAAEVFLPSRFVSAQPTAETTVPGKVSTPKVGRIAAGGGQSILISETSKEASGWGLNTFGQVGTGATTSQVTAPTKLSDQEFNQIAAGAQHTVGLGDDLRLYGWGSDEYGQTGTGSQAAHQILEPTEAVAPQGVTFTQVAAGTHTSLALDTSGKVWGWGSGSFGALGKANEGSIASQPTLLVQPTATQFIQVEAGNQTTFAVDTDGLVWGMGLNEGGQLGLGRSVYQTNVFTQIPMPDNARIVQIVANGSTENQQTLALTDNGDIIAWGMNEGGEAGVGLDGSQPSSVWNPRMITAPEDVRFTKLAAGDGVSLALSSTGQVYSWGLKTLGYETPYQTAIPTIIGLPAVDGGYTDITAGDAHAFALSANGKLYGWGWQNSGRLASTSTGFVLTPNLIDLSQIRTAGDSEHKTDLVTDQPRLETGGTEPQDESLSENGVDQQAEVEGPQEGACLSPEGSLQAPDEDTVTVATCSREEHNEL